MRTYFRFQHCPSCGKTNDIKRCVCSHCGEHLLDERDNPFAKHLGVPFFKEPIFLILALIGLSGIAAVIQLIQTAVLKANNPEITSDGLYNALTSVEYSSLTNLLSYGIIFIAMGLLLWSAWKDVFRSFKGWKPYVFAIAGFGAIIVFEMLYGYFTNFIAQSLGIASEGNANQRSIVGIVGYTPILSLLVFGVIGPFVEELAYRVGLFGFVSRLGKVFGFIATTIIFGLIHFDFGAGFDFSADGRNAMILEWLNLPNYLFSGLVFSFLYDKFGFACSFLSHATNNVFSILMIIIDSRTSS